MHRKATLLAERAGFSFRAVGTVRSLRSRRPNLLPTRVPISLDPPRGTRARQESGEEGRGEKTGGGGGQGGWERGKGIANAGRNGARRPHRGPAIKLEKC